jgi:YD repeat-containing protein
MRDPELGTERQVFDADGRVTQVGYPGGESVHYSYSARGEVTSVRDPALAALATTTSDWQLAYDRLGGLRASRMHYARSGDREVTP